MFEAQRRLLQDGAAACVAYLEQNFRQHASPVLALADLLLLLAQRVRGRFPLAALDLLAHIESMRPENAIVLTMQAGLFDRLGRQPEARATAEKVVYSASAGPAQRLEAANLLVRLVDDARVVDAARMAFEQLGRPLREAGSLLYIALRVADWSLAAQLIAQLQTAIAEDKQDEARESARTHLLWCDSERANLEMLRIWATRFAHAPSLEPFGRLPAPTGRKLRVGYLSSDFRDHPTSRLINGLLRHHDHRRFELFMYCSGWDDGSAMRRDIVAHFDQVHSVAGLSDEQAARLIRSHAIDVLVELNGPTRANRVGVLASRPAPVQIGYLGWPGSYGGGCVDYIVGDSYVIPAGVEALYPEKVIRLSDTYQVNDYAARPVVARPERSQVGLPEGEFPILGMFNAINKVRQEVWAVWMQILQQVPQARLWILDPGATARMHIAKTTRAMGVDPARILAAPSVKQDWHLARLQCCDLMLDPWPYGGHTSTADALFAGVPVVALEGSNFAGRVSGSLLHAAGLGALVRPDQASYIRTAVHLLRQPVELSRLRAFIRERVPQRDVFNAQNKARQLETAYLAAYQRVVDGKAPVHIQFERSAPPASDALANSVL